VERQYNPILRGGTTAFKTGKGGLIKRGKLGFPWRISILAVGGGVQGESRSGEKLPISLQGVSHDCGYGTDWRKALKSNGGKTEKGPQFL